MVTKGKARANAFQLGAYLIDNAKKENERIKIIEVRSGSTNDLKAALLDMELANENTMRGEKPLYHMQINPAKGDDYKMTMKDWLFTVDEHEKSLGFTGQDRVIVWHEKRGKDGELRRHAHVVWSRVKDGKLLSISHNYVKHDQARERSEKALKQQQTRQPKDIKNDLTNIWHNSRDGQDFINKAFAKGYKIGRGETRAYCVLTPDGQKLDLVRQLQKIKTNQVKERFKDIEATLPHEKNLIGQSRENDRQNKKRIRTEKTNSRTAALTQAKETLQDIAQPSPIEKTAKEAKQVISDITEKNKAAPQPTPQPQPKTWAEKLQEFKTNAKPDKNETAREAGKNFNEITANETPTQRRIREALENLKRDDFGLEHEIS